MGRTELVPATTQSKHRAAKAKLWERSTAASGGVGSETSLGNKETPNCTLPATLAAGQSQVAEEGEWMDECEHECEHE